MTNLINIQTKTDKMGAALEKLKRDLPALIEYQAIRAKIQRKAYLSYIENGFTADQALTLCAKGLLQ